MPIVYLAVTLENSGSKNRDIGNKIKPLKNALLNKLSLWASGA